ncbi:tyrosine-type recombinase/integrase [Dyadobacter sandarakinus]|uniref:Tyrosine recombinase XerC n=1 Tax=Dyadobacter sandarakinus TaxID=2747268 RepID=A0ABX7IAZ8_9BACT|nr:tyrosine-type recombinase/integrase [Dyadobacter sandarakinus]QRR02707.1 tyrosine-type recombinase/integrase [Dyadobacter sandarakinus]
MIGAFLEYLQFEKRSSAHTVKSYQTDLDQFSKYLLFQYDCAEPENAAPPMLRSWIASLMDEKMNPTSVNRKIATLHAYYRFLKKKNLLRNDPSKILSSLKTRKKLPAFVEEKSMELMFGQELFADDWQGVRDRTIMELLYGTGIRLSELVQLQTRDVDLKARTIRVFGKRAKERIVPLPALLVQLLTRYLEVRSPEEDTDTLIITDSGKEAYPVFVQRIVKKYLSAVTTLPQKSPHVLRHTYATHLLNRGADLNAIKELLGHANLAATQVYTHNSIEKLKKTHEQAHPKA